MQDMELYRYLLGIEAPWMLERVKLDLVNQRVDVWAKHEEDLRWPCPECGALASLHDHAPERAWRHLDCCSGRSSYLQKIGLSGTLGEACMEFFFEGFRWTVRQEEVPGRSFLFWERIEEGYTNPFQSF